MEFPFPFFTPWVRILLASRHSTFNLIGLICPHWLFTGGSLALFSGIHEQLCLYYCALLLWILLLPHYLFCLFIEIWLTLFGNSGHGNISYFLEIINMCKCPLQFRTRPQCAVFNTRNLCHLSFLLQPIVSSLKPAHSAFLLLSFWHHFLITGCTVHW